MYKYAACLLGDWTLTMLTGLLVLGLLGGIGFGELLALLK